MRSGRTRERVREIRPASFQAPQYCSRRLRFLSTIVRAACVSVSYRERMLLRLRWCCSLLAAATIPARPRAAWWPTAARKRQIVRRPRRCSAKIVRVCLVQKRPRCAWDRCSRPRALLRTWRASTAYSCQSRSLTVREGCRSRAQVVKIPCIVASRIGRARALSRQRWADVRAATLGSDSDRAGDAGWCTSCGHTDLPA